MVCENQLNGDVQSLLT